MEEKGASRRGYRIFSSANVVLTDADYDIKYNTLDVKTDFLCAGPSFASGMARCVDLFGVFDRYNTSRTPEETDAKALFADFRMTGQDLKWAILKSLASDWLESSNAEREEEQLTLEFTRTDR